LECWGPQPEEGLHSFFYLSGGGHAREVRDALFEAGLLRQDEVFRQAMAAFGPHYPADRRSRAPFFAWSQPGEKIDATTSIPQPLNALDKRIMTLGGAFGSRQDFESAVARY